MRMAKGPLSVLLGYRGVVAPAALLTPPDFNAAWNALKKKLIVMIYINAETENKQRFG